MYLSLIHIYLQNGILAGGLTLVIMILPTIVRTTQESLKTVPQSYREGALALGSGKWHMVRTVAVSYTHLSLRQRTECDAPKKSSKRCNTI